MGIISALTFSLSAVDSVISAPLPLGVRIGVANIVVILTILTVGKKEGFIITVLKKKESLARFWKSTLSITR